MAYYIVRDGTQYGPLERTEVAAGLRKGEFAGTDLYWHDGMNDWKPLSEATVSVEAASSDEEAAPPGLPARTTWFVLALLLLIGGGWLAVLGGQALAVAWAAEAWPTADGTVLTSDAADGRLHIEYRYEIDSGKHTAVTGTPGEWFFLPRLARDFSVTHPPGAAVQVHYQSSAPDTAYLEVGINQRTGAALAWGVVLLWLGLAAALAGWLLPRYGVRREGKFRLQRGSPLARFLPVWGVLLVALIGAALWMTI